MLSLLKKIKVDWEYAVEHDHAMLCPDLGQRIEHFVEQRRRINGMDCAICGRRTEIPKGYSEWALCPKCFESEATKDTKYEDAEEYFPEEEK